MISTATSAPVSTCRLPYFQGRREDSNPCNASADLTPGWLNHHSCATTPQCIPEPPIQAQGSCPWGVRAALGRPAKTPVRAHPPRVSSWESTILWCQEMSLLLCAENRLLSGRWCGRLLGLGSCSGCPVVLHANSCLHVPLPDLSLTHISLHPGCMRSEL